MLGSNAFCVIKIVYQFEYLVMDLFNRSLFAEQNLHFTIKNSGHKQNSGVDQGKIWGIFRVLSQKII